MAPLLGSLAEGTAEAVPINVKRLNMKMRLSTLTLLFVVIPGVAAAADGCPDGSFTVTHVPDNSGLTVIFDEFRIIDVVGPASVTCNRSISARDPNEPTAAGRIEAYSADYRGFVAPDAAAIYTVEENGVIRRLRVRPVEDGTEVLLHTFLRPDDAGYLNSNIDIAAAGDGPNEVASLETVDYLFLGWTTMDSQIASLEGLSPQATAVVTHLNATTGLLVGGDRPIGGPNSIALVGAIGSHTVGITGHANLGDGFSLDGGAVIFDQSVGGAATSGVLLGGKASFVQPEDSSAFRLFSSAGGTYAPELMTRFSRSYTLYDLDDEPGTVTGHANGKASMSALWLEGGVLVAPAPDNEIAFNISYARNWLDFGSVAEKQTDQNPFAFSGSGTSTFDTVKVGSAWTTAVATDLDFTLHAAVGQVWAGDLTGDVALVGPITVGGTDETFAEYGARLGWQATDTTQIDLFARGSTGSVTGTHVQVGSSLSMKF